MTKSMSINHLPPEILAHIFTDTLAGVPLCPRTTSTDLAFAAVCKHWREVCLGVPRIWANIELVHHGNSLDATSLPPSIEAWDKQNASFVSVCIARSSSAPLSIALDCLHVSADQIPLTLDVLLGRSDNHSQSHSQNPSSRWSSLRVRASQSIVLQFVDAISTGAPPLKLEHLDIERGSVRDLNGQSLDLCPSLCYLPKLHKLRIAGSRSDLFLFSTKDHALLHSLRQLEIQVNKYMILPNYLALLRLCPNLAELTLRGRFYEGISRRRFDQLVDEARVQFHAIVTTAQRETCQWPLPLLHLHTLHITGPAWASELLLACISAPGLRSIEVGERNDRGLFVGGFIVRLMEANALAVGAPVRFSTSILTMRWAGRRRLRLNGPDGSAMLDPPAPDLRRLLIPYRRLADTSPWLFAAVHTIRTLGLAYYMSSGNRSEGGDGGFCNLEALVVKSNSKSALKSESSEEDAYDSDEDPEPDVSLPNLEELIVYSHTQDKLQSHERAASCAARVLVDVLVSRCPPLPSQAEELELQVRTETRAITVTRLKKVQIVLVYPDENEHHEGQKQTPGRSTHEFDWLVNDSRIQRCVKEGLRIDVCARRESGVFEV